MQVYDWLSSASFAWQHILPGSGGKLWNLGGILLYKSFYKVGAKTM